MKSYTYKLSCLRTSQARVVIFWSDVSDFHSFSTHCGQNKPLSEAAAALKLHDVTDTRAAARRMLMTRYRDLRGTKNTTLWRQEILYFYA